MSPRQNQRMPYNNNNNNQRRQPSGGLNQSRSAEPLKFEGEYDFEQANAKFEELEKNLTDKLKIKDDKRQQPATESVSADDVLALKQKLNAVSLDDSKSESKDTTVNKEEDKNFYDKNVSFFDRISCEANDKISPNSNVVHRQPTGKNWKDEKKLNAETFGLKLAANMGYRGYNPRRNNMHHNNNNNSGRNNNMNNNSRDHNNSRTYQNGGSSNGRYNQNGGQSNNNQQRGYNPNSRGQYRPREVEVQNGGRRFGSR